MGTLNRPFQSAPYQEDVRQVEPVYRPVRRSPGIAMYNSPMSVRVRFAPSPTGLLHIGNVRTALFNWLFARHGGGTFVLRIEDTDVERSEKHFEEQLQRDLEWLGLTWDEGVGVGGAYGPYRQTERFEIYGLFARQLLDSGAAYHCFCSQEMLHRVRQEQLAAGQSPRYPGTCRNLDPAQSASRVASGEQPVTRFRVEEGRISYSDLVFGDLSINSREVGDFILLRSDGSAQYNFAVVVDDLLMKITHVIRGEGHISNTHRQMLLYEALGEAPPRFAHLSTILGTAGAKLSKRHGATSLQEFCRQGYLADSMVNYLALLGWTPEGDGMELLDPAQLVAHFRLDRVHKAPAIFDENKLKWVNRHYLGKLAPKELVALVAPHLVARAWIAPPLSPGATTWLENLVVSLRKYLDRGEDIIAASGVVFDFDPERDLTEEELTFLLTEDSAQEVIQELRQQLEQVDELNEAAFAWVLARVKEETGAKGKALFHPVRLALTGMTSGPDLKTLVPLIEEGSHLDLGRPLPGVDERIARVLSQLS